MVTKFRIGLILLLLLLVCRGFCAEEAVPIHYTSDNFSVSFTDEGEIKAAVLEGNVKIVYGSMVIRCEKAVLDRTTGNITAEKGIQISSEFGDFTADRMTYNLTTGSGLLLNARFSSPPLYGKAERLEKEGVKMVLENGYLTTCDLDCPHYRIDCKRIEYVQDHYVRQEQVRVILGKNFKVFYLPRYTHNLKANKPGMTIIPKYRTRLGQTMGVTFNHSLDKDSEFISSERADLGAQGMGLGWEVSSVRDKVRFSTFGLRPWSEDEIGFGGLAEYQRSRESKYGNSGLILDWRWMRDNEFFTDCFQKDYYNKTGNYNYFSLSQETPAGILNLLAREKAREEELEIEKLPEFRFFTPHIQLGNQPLYYRNNLQVTRYVKEETEYVRFLNNLSLEGKKDLGFFNLKPWVSVTPAAYYRAGTDMVNTTREIGLEVSSLFEKKHSSGRTEYLVPALSFLTRAVDYRSAELPFFDEQELLENGKFAGLSLSWNLWESTGEQARLVFENFYDLNRDRFADSLFKYDCKLSRSIRINGENMWNFTSGDLRLGVNDLVFDRKTIRCGVGSRYLKDKALGRKPGLFPSGRPTGEAWGVENWLEQTLGKNWKYRVGVFYDFRESELVSHQYEIWRRVHCWLVDFKLSFSRDDTSFYIAAYPAAFAETETWKERFSKWK